MTIQECYAKIGGSYAEIEGRLRMPALIERFALKFLADGSFRELTEYLNAGNTKEAFRAAHTLKGVCSNLAFTELYKVSVKITELLRGEDLEGARAVYGEVEAIYNEVIAALTEYQNSK